MNAIINVCTAATCARYADKGTVFRTDETPHGRVECLTHISEPWHGTAARAVHADGHETYHRHLPAAKAQLEMDSRKVPWDVRRDFRGAVSRVASELADAEPGTEITVLASTGQIKNDNTRPERLVWFEVRPDTTRVDDVMWRLREHPYWQARFNDT